MVTSQPRMLLPAGSLGYACKADKNVSDQASAASTGPTSARHTRITRAPCSATISSKGRAARCRGAVIGRHGGARAGPVPPRALQLAGPPILGALNAPARKWRRSQSSLPQGDAHPARGKAEARRRRPLEHLGDAVIDAPARPAEDQQIAGAELDVFERAIATADAGKPEHAAVAEAQGDDRSVAGLLAVEMQSEVRTRRVEVHDRR